jgi:hypothetical protein
LEKLFAEEARQHFAHGPLFSNQPGIEPDGNGVLYTAFYFETLVEYGQLTPGVAAHFRAMVQECRIAPGLIDRGKHKRADLQKHDDYIGYCRMAQLIDPTHAREVFLWGKQHGWVFKNLERKLNWKEWWNTLFWRIPGVVQHIKICAGEELSWLDRILFFLGFWSTTLRAANSTSGRQMDWLRWQAYRDYGHEYWLCNLGVKLFEKDLRKRYPFLMGSVFQIFFQRDPTLMQQPQHVLARWWQGKI